MALGTLKIEQLVLHGARRPVSKRNAVVVAFDQGLKDA